MRDADAIVSALKQLYGDNANEQCRALQDMLRLR